MQNDNQRGYNFHYDDLSRITAADYQNNDANTDKNYSTTYVYDNMGNIKNLTRYGLSAKPSTSGMIDNLTLNYNGNQLSSVADASTSEPSYSGAFNFVKASVGTPEYTYDANGNLTRDSHKKIAKIQYNILNLPSALQFTEGHTSEYLYDAAGVKRKVKQVTTTGNLLVPMGSMLPVPADKVAVTTQTDYCGNVIYENGVLSRILVDDGYITMNGTTPTYHYYIQDHQGNNRVVFNQNGTIEQTNHYYPFGMTFGEGIDNSDNRYKYNGKELDRMHGLDLYDYGARHYDAAIGRWGVMDPLAEKYYSISPYAYCANNPIRLIDTDGRKIVTYEIKKNDKRGQPEAVYNSISYKTRMALATVMLTKEGRDFFSSYASAGDEIGGVKFSKNGKYSDYSLNVFDYSYSEELSKSPSEASAAIGKGEGGNVNLYIYSYMQSDWHDIVEDVAHETQLHGFSLKKLMHPTPDADHAAIRDKDMRNEGYRRYKALMSYLIAIKKISDAVEKAASQKYKENYPK